MINGLPVPAMFIDPNMQCVKANLMAKDMFPLWHKGLDFSSVINEPVVLDIVRESIADGGVHDCEVVMGNRPQRIFQIRVNGKIRRNKKRRILVVFYEVTEQRKLEKIRAAFVANVSHELRSPLTTLLGAIEAVHGMKDRNSDTATHFLDIMQGEADRMRLIVNDLLILSSTEAKAEIAPIGNINILPLISEMINGLYIQAEKRKIEIKVDTPSTLPHVPADAKEIVQVLHNLTDNAIKYSKQGSEIFIKAEQVMPCEDWPLGAVSVMCQNFGDVIPQDKIPRLTERFFRLDSSRSRDMGGTGLGLAIVKHIMNRHRGRLTINSSVEDGTKFTIFLPFRDKK
jgi:two-component system, OmpR family, phosphate regulon sensor histidine kinase PhoR